ncbi:MAG TPA: recombinase family protein [Firmicutes bacterium]|nr:recombinase family protein [Bacillota bacterium]
MRKPAAMYIRRSTDRQENSPEVQRSVIQERLPEGLEVVATYEDTVSGKFIDRRPGLMQMLRDAEARKFEAVVFYKYDRAFRNAEEQAVILGKFRRSGIAIYSILDPPGEGPAGGLIVNILGAVNQFERELIGERVYQTNRHLAQGGRWTGGRRVPLGYNYDRERKQLVVNPEEADLVRLVFRLYLECESAYGAAKRLRETGRVTKYGNPWTCEAVRDVVTNPLYIGKLRWGHRRAVPGMRYRPRCADFEVFDGQQEAIVDEETFARAQAIRAARQRAPRSSAASPHLLTNLGRCSICGSTIAAGRPDRYRCQSPVTGRDCTHWSRKTSYLENTIYKLLLTNIEQSELPEHYRAVRPSGAAERDFERDLARLNAQLDRQMAAYEAGAYTLEEFRDRRAAIENEKRAILANMQAARARLTEAELEALRDFGTLWDRSDVAGRRKLLRSLVQRFDCDGSVMRVYFWDLGIAGWQTVMEDHLVRDDYFRYWLAAHQEAAAARG